MAKVMSMKNLMSRRYSIFNHLHWQTVGQIMKSRRKELNLTLEFVADESETHKGYISGIENGKVNPPSAGQLTLICSVLKLDVQEIMMRSWAEKAPMAILERVIMTTKDHLKSHAHREAMKA